MLRSNFEKGSTRWGGPAGAMDLHGHSQRRFHEAEDSGAVLGHRDPIAASTSLAAAQVPKQ
jgi:hypothetical protein